MKFGASIPANVATFGASTEVGGISAGVGENDRSPALELPGPFHETRYGWLVLIVVWLACATYTGLQLRQGWIPDDSGELALMANRVLHGQVPHRDFSEVYTGGLSYVNAMAFHLFGENLFSMRIPQFLLFVAWIPAVFFLGRRFAGPILAGMITLLAVAWSMPIYPESRPSWYNLFFATWGVLALVRYTETERRRWLWIAGLCGGLSFLVKISALYFVVAGVLFLIFREQSVSRQEPDASRHGRLLYRLFVSTGLLLFLGSLTSLVSQRPTAGEFFQFVLPSGCLVAFLLWELWREPSSGSAVRFRRLFSMALPFVGAALIPVAIFLLWYARQGAIAAWVEGTFVRAGMRPHWTGYDALPLTGLIVLIPVILILIAAFDLHPTVRRLARVASPLVLALLLLAAWKWYAFYLVLGCSPPFIVVFAALAVPFCLGRHRGVPDGKRQQAFLLVAAAVTWGLIQFPYSMIMYFNYVAPLLALALVALYSTQKRGEKVALGSVLVFYLVFALWLHAPGYFVAIGVPPYQPRHLRPVALARVGGVVAPPEMAAEYEELVAVVREHAHGPYIYAAPDIPEVYFLSGYENPTGTVYDFLDPDFFNPTGRQQRILSALDACEVNLVVLGPGNHSNSGPLRAGLLAALDERFPQSAKVGKFEVRWKP